MSSRQNDAKENKADIELDLFGSEILSQDVLQDLNIEDIALDADPAEDQQKSKDSDFTQDNTEVTEDEIFGQDVLQNLNIDDIAVEQDATFRKDTLSSIHAEPSEPDTNESESPLHHFEEVQPPPPVQSIIKQAASYAELNRISDKILSELEGRHSAILLLCSPSDETGQTLVAATLGYTIARKTELAVLLVDANMRHPSLHTLFGVKQKNGLTRMIKENLPWQSVVKKTELANLHILTAGEVDCECSEDLQTLFFPDLFASFRKTFDVVILDTSPILVTNKNNFDTVFLANMVDYCLMVVNNDLNSVTELKEAKEIISSGNGTIDGIIYNHRPVEPLYTVLLRKTGIKKMFREHGR